MKTFRENSTFLPIKRWARLLTLVGTLTVLAQFGATASAMCIYNSTDKEIYVEFDCGWFCENDWTTEPQNHYCRAGKKGTFKAGLLLQAQATVQFDVDAHGWVEIVPVDQVYVQACAYAKSGERQTCRTWNFYDPTDVKNY